MRSFIIFFALLAIAAGCAQTGAQRSYMISEANEEPVRSKS